jgi:hypothetical protein
MAACNVLEIKQIFASYDYPKCNTDTKMVIRTIKENLVWLNDFVTPFELQLAVRATPYDTQTKYSRVTRVKPNLSQALEISRNSAMVLCCTVGRLA